MCRLSIGWGTGQYSDFLYQPRDEAMLKLPVPDMSPEREGEFCAAVSDRNGMDIARLAG